MKKHDYDLFLLSGLRRLWREVPEFEAIERTPGETIFSLLNYDFPNQRNLTKQLQLWLVIYDECVAWIVSLHFVSEVGYSRAPKRKDRRKPIHHLLEAVFLITGRILSDMLSVRLLICGGFNSSARALARSTLEHIDLISLLLICPELAKEFCSSRTSEVSNVFWHRHISKNKMRKAISRYFESVGAKEATDYFQLLREDASSIYNMSLHPSFMSCYSSLFHLESPKEEGPLFSIGVPTDFSCNIINTFIVACLEMSIVLHFSCFNKESKKHNIISPNLDNYFHNVLLTGNKMLLSILTWTHRPDLSHVFFGGDYKPENVTDTEGKQAK